MGNVLPREHMRARFAIHGHGQGAQAATAEAFDLNEENRVDTVAALTRAKITAFARLSA